MKNTILKHLRNKKETDNCKKDEEKYYAEISLASRLRSKLSYEELLHRFDSSNVKVHVTLETGDGQLTDLETLELWELEWESWNDI